MGRRTCSIGVSLLLFACGAARPSSETTPESRAEPAAPDCAVLRADAEQARGALDRCREATPIVAWAHRDAFTWLDEHLGAHLAAAREGTATATTMIQVQEIAERVWTLLDDVREDASDRGLLDRTEDAAEALMRQQDAEGRERALAGLAGALGALRADLEPSAPPTCELEEREAATRWMSVQAQCSDESGEL